MDAISAAAAESHYQAGRHHDALLVFERQPIEKSVTNSAVLHSEKNKSCGEQDDWITAEDPPVKIDELKVRAELQSLPQLARLADIAMCRFQSALHSYNLLEERAVRDKDDVSIKIHESKSPDLIRIWEEAIEANVGYRQSLMGAASSLIHTCFTEEEFLHQIKQLPMGIQSTNKEKENRIEEQIGIRNAMKHTAISILMSAVASAHLYLYSYDDEADMKPWATLVQSAMVAADLISVQRDLAHCISGAKINTDRRRNALEPCLDILNETMVDERSVVALHSFRTALKVAALANGKLVLPDVEYQFGEDIDEPVKKRAKHQKIPDQLTANRGSNAWNATYNHGNLALHTREKLVDAISFHSALIHLSSKVKEPTINKGSKVSTTINDVYQKRESCFKQALEWESKMKALVSCNTSPTSGDDASGFVWKIYTCIRALDMSNQNLILVSSNRGTCYRPKVLSELEALASCSTSKFACDMLGYIYALNKGYSSAIRMFQLSLEQGIKTGEGAAIYPDIVTDSGSCCGLAEHSAVINMALCFVAQGGAETALELLLNVWAILNDSNGEKSPILSPQVLLCDSCHKCIGNMCATSIDNSLTTASMKLLWLIFHVSSLVGDLNTSLETAELIKSNSIDEGILSCVRINIANAFSLLQCRRNKDSQEVAQNMIDKLSTISQCIPTIIPSILGELYIADGALTSESINYNNPLQSTTRAKELLNSFISEFHTVEFGPFHQLRVLVLNNYGIGCLTGDDSAGALSHFRKAAELAKSAMCETDCRHFWLLTPIHFNLALLLLRDGRVDESAKTWLSIRGHFNTYELARRSDGNALLKLRNIHLIAMNNYGMMLANRNIPSKATVSSSNTNSSEWVAPIARAEKWQEETICINGVDAAHVCTMDFILLKYALSVAERKCGAFQRHK